MVKLAPTPLDSFKLKPSTFEKNAAIFADFKSDRFRSLPERTKFRQINQTLVNLILEATPNSFLLSSVVDFIDQVQKHQLLHQRYQLSSFEFWLNHYSGLSPEENYKVRAKIVGKFLPRDDYQILFPIGMDKTFAGTHFVAAHLSPDVDTMVASFWGWIDAFAARVGSARHIWSLPGGAPDCPVTNIFRETFGEGFFAHTASIAPNLSLAAIDLVTQQHYLKKTGHLTISSLDLNTSEKAIILVDDQGYYLGDWQHFDIEPIRKIIVRFKSCLRWFENNLHVKLISLFAKSDLHIQDFPQLLSSLFDIAIQDCEPVKEFSERQKADLNDFFKKVLKLEKGLKGTFGELNEALAKLSVYDLKRFQEQVEALKDSALFNQAGTLNEDRPLIFNTLVKIINQLDSAIQRVRDYAERLDVAIQIKHQVFGIPSQFITLRYDVEDIRLKMDKRDYLTVVIAEDDDKLFPIGVVWAHSLNKATLGTVTFRDFCNQEEVKMASYLSPISAIDHHKASLKTNTPPNALIADAQSCNVLVAEQAFRLNDRYSLNGMSTAEIETQLNQLKQVPVTLENSRLLRRLLQRQAALAFSDRYYVHPLREYTEYFYFLHAILDDTDLLTKVSKRDVECVVELLNRLSSLKARQECEVINLDHIPHDRSFAKEAAKRILRNPDMYAFYRQIYDCKEKEIEESLNLCLDKKFDALFVDTKIQNGCCSVGQTKLFSLNFPTFLKIAPAMISYWVDNAVNTEKLQPLIDLHIHMVSTIASAEEVYQDRVGHYKHQDQLWFWVASRQRGYDHLISFLNGFLIGQPLGASARFEFLPGVSEEIQHLVLQNSGGIPCEKNENGPNLPVVILHFAAGTINSRKAMITPYLPKFN